jgi:acyl-CoA reductase-like NAD-dependent aldehyde dehydrogenase
MTLIVSKNPSRNHELIDSIEWTEKTELADIVQKARNAQKIWAKLSPSDRVKKLEKVYSACQTERENLAKYISLEMGMPIRQARDEVIYGMTYFRWYLDHAVEYLRPEVTRETDTELHTVFYEPRGLIVAIAPWNYPFSMAIWTCIQPLLAGNSVIFKTSRECILTWALIANIFKKADLPEWVWMEVYGTGELWDALMTENIDGITFTGSTRVGKNLAKIAIDKWISAVMELGWSAPGIVTSSADLAKVIDMIYFLRFSNAGQMCDGLKRLIVHRSRYGEVVDMLRKILLSKKIGDAQDEQTDIGPLVSSSQVERLDEQYRDALEKWAEVLAELPIPDEYVGAFTTPKILWNITRDMKVWKEEVFGPILPIVVFDTLDEAIELANDTEYGLGAYVFTEDRELFEKIASEIHTGMVQMNNLNYCIPENPFWGIKNSGIGREHGKWGFHEFCNIKVTSIPKK